MNGTRRQLISGGGFRMQRCLIAAGMVLLIATTMMVGQEAQPTESGLDIYIPGMAPATSTAPASAPTSGPSVGIDAMLDLTTRERIILEDIRDRDSQIDESGTYVVLKKIAILPQLTDEQFNQLSQISTRSLKDRPERYRLMPTRVMIKVFAMRKVEDGEGIDSPKGPRHAPVWILTGLDVSSKSPTNEPLKVLSIADPTELLGKPVKVLEKESQYRGITLEMAGVFYKVQKHDSVNGEEGFFPVILAWQLRPGYSAGGGPSFQWSMIVICIILLGLFFFLRHQAKKTRLAMKPDDLFHRRRRLAAQSGKPVGPAIDKFTDEYAEVDPDLKAAAEQARNGKGPAAKETPPDADDKS